MAQHAQPPWYLRRDLTPIGQLLVEYMRDHGLATQQELAAHIGIKQQSLSEYLAPNGRIPRPRALQRIAHATGIPLITLYHAAGIPLYGGEAANAVAPPPARYVPPLRLPEDTPHTARDALYHHIESLTQLSPEERQTILNELEDVLRGRDPYRKYRVGEALVVEADQPAPTSSAEMPEKTLRHSVHSTKDPGIGTGDDGAD